jgi:AbrB family looped-hinge helix DNA binding protein
VKILLIKKINKCGQVLIPKQIQKQLSIQDGDFLYIYYHKGIIVVEKIEKQNEKRTLNQCILSNGRVSIPAELRRILKMNLDTHIIMESSISDKKIYLRQSYPLSASKEA